MDENYWPMIFQATHVIMQVRNMLEGVLVIFTELIQSRSCLFVKSSS
jgi:hypothetical protein